MATLRFDSSGRIETGYFFEIYTAVTEEDLAQATEDWVISLPKEPWPPLSATAVTLLEEEVRECPHDPTHCTAKRPKRIELDLSDGITQPKLRVCGC